MKRSEPSNDNLVDRTIKTWQPRADSSVSREDARQIVENITGFFAILGDWASAELPEPANDTSPHEPALEPDGNAERAFVAIDDQDCSDEQC